MNQTACTLTDEKFTIDITDTTFNKENIKQTLKKVGSAIGDGVDFLVKGAKRVYHSVKNDENTNESGKQNRYREREETTDGHHIYFEPNAELL